MSLCAGQVGAEWDIFFGFSTFSKDIKLTWHSSTQAAELSLCVNPDCGTITLQWPGQRQLSLCIDQDSGSYHSAATKTSGAITLHRPRQRELSLCNDQDSGSYHSASTKTAGAITLHRPRKWELSLCIDQDRGSHRSALTLTTRAITLCKLRQRGATTVRHPGRRGFEHWVWRLSITNNLIKQIFGKISGPPFSWPISLPPISMPISQPPFSSSNYRRVDKKLFSKYFKQFCLKKLLCRVPTQKHSDSNNEIFRPVMENP